MNESFLPLGTTPWQNNAPTLQKRWEVLKQENRFSQVAADLSCVPMNVQCKIGNNLEAILDNQTKLSSVGELIKYQEETYLRAILISFFNRLSSLAVGNNSLNNDSNIDELVSMILNDPEYKSWKIVEFNLIIDMAIKGKFEKIYRIDANVVFDWINEYSRISATAIRTRRDKEHNNMKAGLKIHPDIASMCLNVLKPMVPPSPVRKEVNINPHDFINDPSKQSIIDGWKLEYTQSGRTIPLLDYLYSRAITLLNQMNQD